MAAAGVPVLRRSTRRGHRRGPAAAGQGGGGRRRARHADRARRWPTCRRGVGGGPGRGAGGVRRRRGLRRAVRRGRPAHRGAGAGRRARHGVDARRARLLDPAPAPEDDRGDAGAGRRRRGCAPGCCDAAARGGPRDRLRRRGHRRVPGRAGRQAVLPGDEHPAPGRAPGDRVRHRARPGRAAARGSPRAPRCPPNRRPPRGHAIEARLYAEDPARDWQPQTGTLHRSTSRRARFDRPPRRAAAGLRGGRTATVVGVHYDPMLAKVDRLGADTRAEAAAAAGARPGAGPDPRPGRPTATCWSGCCGIRSSRAARVPTPASSTGTRRPGPRAPDGRTRGCRLAALAAALADAARAASPCSAAGGTCPRSRRSSATGPSRTATEHEVRYRLTRDGPAGRRASRACCSTAAAPDRVVLEVAGVRQDVRGRRVRRRACTSTRPAARSRSPPCRASPTRSGAPRPVRCSRRCPAPSSGSPRSRSATGSTAGQPLLWLEAMKMEHRDQPRRPPARSPSCTPSRAGRSRSAPCWPSWPRTRRDRGRRQHAEHSDGRHRRTDVRTEGAPHERHLRQRPGGERGARALRAAVAALGRALRPRLLHRRRPRRAADRRAVARGRQARLPRRQPAGGVRRRGRRASSNCPSCWRSWARPAARCCCMVVSPAICGTVIARFGTEEQKRRWLPGLADGSPRMAFGITEPDAGSNSHRITTTARRDGDDWVLTGRKVFISGVDVADATLIVGRTEDARTGKLKPCLFIVPRDARASSTGRSTMDLVGAGEAVPALPRRRAAAGRRAGRRRGRRAAAAVRRAQPGADHGRGVLASAWAATRWTRRSSTPAPAQVWERADRRPPGHRAPARPGATSSWNWPG